MTKSVLRSETPQRAAKRKSRLRFGAALRAAASALARPASAAGAWTPAPTNPGVGQAFGLWMLNGRPGHLARKSPEQLGRPTPDAKGSYANGTWKAVASSVYARGGAQEHVLPDGRFFEAGGEYIYVWPPGRFDSDYIAEEPELCRLVVLEARGLSDYLQSEIADLHRRYQAFLLQAVAEGVESGVFSPDVEPGLVRHLVYGTTEHVGWAVLLRSADLDVERLTDELMAIIEPGLVRRGDVAHRLGSEVTRLANLVNEVARAVNDPAAAGQ